jgi:hypothetical protein
MFTVLYSFRKPDFKIDHPILQEVIRHEGELS